MRKFFCLVSIFIFIAFIYAQEEGFEKRLEKLGQRLQEIHTQIYDLKQEAQKNPSSDLEEKIARLQAEAQDLDRQIQEIQEKMGAEQKPPQPPQPPVPPREKMNTPLPPEQMRPEYRANLDFRQQALKKDIEQKKQELEKIEQEMKECDPKEKEYLTILRERTLQEMKVLETQLKFIGETQKRFKNKGESTTKTDRREKYVKETQDGIEPKIRAFMEELRQDSPEEFQRLMNLRNQNPREFRERLHEMMKEVRKNNEVKGKDPEVAQFMKKEMELNRKMKELAKSIRQIPYEQREAKIAELKSILTEAFLLRMQMREKETSELRKKLEKMEQQLQKRMQNKDIIIDQRLKDLIGEGEEWVW